MNKAVSIRSIAKECGVSPMTVSFALKNNPRVAKSTRERIQKKAKALGYHSDPEVVRYMRHIASKREHRIKEVLGFIHLSGDNEREQEIGAVAEQRARDLGYGMHSVWASDFENNMKRISEIFRSRGIAAFVVGNAQIKIDTLDFDWSAFSVVELGHTIRNPPVNRVLGNHFDNSILALEKILETGYRRIAFVSPKNVCELHFNRSYSAYLFQTSSDSKAHAVTPLIFDKGLNCARFADWFKTHRPDAIYTTSELPYEYLNEMGVNIPEEVGLVEYRDSLPSNSEVSAVVEDRRVKVETGIDLLVSMKQKFEIGLPKFPIMTVVNGTWRQGSTLRQTPVRKAS